MLGSLGGPTTLSDRVAMQIRREILDGTLSPGTRLLQNEIADRLNVSTTPVREAFSKLQGEGLLVIDRHKGALVFTPSLEDFRELFAIRELLESYAVSRAVPRLDAHVIAELERCLTEMEHVADGDSWVRLNNEFHLTLYRAAGLPRLTQMIAMMRDASAAYLHMFASARRHGPRHDGRDDHAAILDACKSADAEMAVEVTRRHLQDAVIRVTSRQIDSESTSLYEAITGRDL